MVSHTVLCAFVLALVAVSQSKPHHDQGFMSRGFQQQRHDMDRLMAYNVQQRRQQYQQQGQEQDQEQDQHMSQEQGKRHQHQYNQDKKTQRHQYQDQDQEQSQEQRYDHEQQYQSGEQYSQKHGQYESYNQEQRKFGHQQQEQLQQRHQGAGKMQSCDGTEDLEQPCVVQDKSKQVRVQDTSSDESQERRTIKMVTSQEDRDSSIEVKQAPKPTPIHHGKGTQYHQEKQHNVQTSRRGNDDEDSQSFEDNSQERKNKMHKY